MSEQPDEASGQHRDTPDDPIPSPDAPLEERPPVAGGKDDRPPAQGEGAPNSW